MMAVIIGEPKGNNEILLSIDYNMHRESTSKGLPIRRKKQLEDYVCICPECDRCCDFEPRYSGKTVLPDRLILICPDCGTFNVSCCDGRWRLDDGRPYVPEADDNSVTRYSVFDPSSYEDERTAVNEEIVLLISYVHNCYVFDLHEELDAGEKRLNELLGKAYSMGIDDHIPAYIASLLGNMEWSNRDAVDERCVKIMENARTEQLPDILAVAERYFSSDGSAFKLAKATAGRIERHYTGMTFRDRDELAAAVDAINSMDGSFFLDVMKIAESLLETARSMERTELQMAILYSLIVSRQLPCEERDIGMRYLNVFREELPGEFVSASVEYVMGLYDQDCDREFLRDLIGFGIGYLGNVCFDDRESLYDDLARYHFYRNIMDDDQNDLVQAGRYAVVSISFGYDDYSRNVLRRCLAKDGLTKEEREELKKYADTVGIDLRNYGY